MNEDGPGCFKLKDLTLSQGAGAAHGIAGYGIKSNTARLGDGKWAGAFSGITSRQQQQIIQKPSHAVTFRADIIQCWRQITGHQHA